MTRRWRRLACATLLVAILVGACDGCEPAPVAELAAWHNRVSRDFDDARGRWRPAATGARFHMGDGLRTGPDSTAELRLSPEGRLRVESDTLVRFQKTPPGQQAQRVEVESGAVELEASALELEVETPAGVARVQRGSRVTVSSDGRELAFSVSVGKVELEQNGTTFSAREGEGFVVDVGTLEIERTDDSDGRNAEAAAAAAQTDAAVDEAPNADDGDDADEGELGAVALDTLRFDDPPPGAQLTLRAGVSTTVHDPQPPTDVRVVMPDCREGGVLELAQGNGPYGSLRARGQARDGARLRVPLGTHRYRVRCIDGALLATRAVARGRLRVVRDAGTRQLPRKPPRVRADADGRRYTVRYQNRLPRLELRWPNAPPAPGYSFELTPESGAVRHKTLTRPSIELPSGSLREGVHHFAFATSDAKHESSGSVRIVFDDTATTAHISEPDDGAVEAGARLRIAGGALRGSQVRVAGQDIPLSPRGRFDAELATPMPSEGIAVRVQHPATGVHHYVRRPAPAPGVGRPTGPTP